MTAPLYRVTAGPHAGFVGRVDSLFGKGLLLLAAGTEVCVAHPDDLERDTTPSVLRVDGETFDERGARLMAMIAIARAGVRAREGK